MKYFYIILTVVVFTATSWGPGPCYTPVVFDFDYRYDTVFADTCSAAADQVFQASASQLYNLQIDSAGVRYIEYVNYFEKVQ